MYEKEKRLLPDFPRTMHLPLEPNAQSDDKVASESEMRAFLSGMVQVTEKVDGANCGIAIVDGRPIVRNRNHILNKAYARRKTPAQQQFSPVWTWLYENSHKIEEASRLYGAPVSVYGEWLFARHVLPYDQLPDLFVAYDVFDQAAQEFVTPLRARDILVSAGFAVVPQLACDIGYGDSELLMLRDGQSRFSGTSAREGIYLKAVGDDWCPARYKMVAPWFRSDDDWNKKPLVKNGVRKMQHA